MDITITTFLNPFSFFGSVTDSSKKINDSTLPKSDYGKHTCYPNDLTDLDHGQYVAVLWHNEWVRGVITMESQFRIWLVDHGIFLRPDDKTVYISLPPEFKNDPTEVFEASIHGVVPIDKVLNEECQIEDQCSTQWNKGALEKGLQLISSATKTFFVPIGLMSTKFNDVVVGDLYLDINGKTINIIDALEMWPVFLQRNKEAYIENLSTFYTSRRRHHASQLKPIFPKTNLPSLTLSTTLLEYSAICETVPILPSEQEPSIYLLDGSLVGLKGGQKSFELTPEEIHKYSQMTVVISERKYNVLNILVNKARDLMMCEKYKDFDCESVGRGYPRTGK